MNDGIIQYCSDKQYLHRLQIGCGTSPDLPFFN